MDMASFAAAVGVSWSGGAVVLPAASAEDGFVGAASSTGAVAETEEGTEAAAEVVVRDSSVPVLAPKPDDGVSSVVRGGGVELSLVA